MCSSVLVYSFKPYIVYIKISKTYYNMKRREYCLSAYLDFFLKLGEFYTTKFYLEIFSRGNYLYTTKNEFNIVHALRTS